MRSPRLNAIFQMWSYQRLIELQNNFLSLSDEDLVDVKETLTEKCRDDSHCAHYREELEKCEERVNSRSNTTETCEQELFDFIHCVDHCVSKTLFKHLKWSSSYCHVTLDKLLPSLTSLSIHLSFIKNCMTLFNKW